MTTFAIATSIPLGSTLAMPAAGAVLGTLLVFALAVSVAGIVASAATRPVSAERGKHGIGSIGFGTPIAHHGAA